jgi:hypothetical protein
VTPAAVADFRRYPLISALAAVHTAADHLQVHWADGRISPFHHPWLRDNCPCPLCVYSVTREQTLEIVDMGDDLAPDMARIDSRTATAASSIPAGCAPTPTTTLHAPSARPTAPIASSGTRTWRYRYSTTLR